MIVAAEIFPIPRPRFGATSIGAFWCAAFLAAIAVSLWSALVVPLALTVYGLIAFGLLHNFFELRYVIGRYCLTWTRPVSFLAMTTFPLFVARRLLVPGPLGALVEIALTYVLIIGTICISSWSVRQKLLLVLPALAASALSVIHSETHFVALAHLHNVLPLVFLWWWSESLPSGPARTGFRAVQVCWTLVLPLLILAGGIGAPIGPLMMPGSVLAGDWHAFGRHKSASLDRALEHARLPDTRFIAGFAVVLAFSLAIVFLMDYWEGRFLYTALASVHAYLELPVILIALAAGRRSLRGGAES
jgi:hypothetical protein